MRFRRPRVQLNAVALKSEARHHGRSNGYAECAATRDDNYRIERKLKPSFRAKGMGWDHPLITPQPLLAYFLLTVHCATHGHF